MRKVHFLSSPGEVDVTADVDFGALVHTIDCYKKRQQLSQESPHDNTREVQAFGPVTQGHFLMSMGAQERVIHAIESDETTEEEAEDLYQALLRLASPEEMGERYKVLAICPTETVNSSAAPPGF